MIFQRSLIFLFAYLVKIVLSKKKDVKADFPVHAMHLKALMHCFFKQLSKELLHKFPLKSLQISMNVDSVYTAVSQISNA